jgi:hypothetical protein
MPILTESQIHGEYHALVAFDNPHYPYLQPLLFSLQTSTLFRKSKYRKNNDFFVLFKQRPVSAKCLFQPPHMALDVENPQTLSQALHKHNFPSLNSTISAIRQGEQGKRKRHSKDRSSGIAKHSVFYRY